MKIGNTTLIPQNVAPYNAEKVAVFDSNNNLVCECALGHLALPNLGTKLYSFGAISDIHTFIDESYKDDVTANDDYAKALTFFRDNADFVCECGDLVGDMDDMQKYKEIRDANKGTLPIYPIKGNHENWGNAPAGYDFQTVTGYGLYYSFTHGNDVFIMVGFDNWTEEEVEEEGTDKPVFTQAELQWLYETLEVNRNKRCFVFQHSNLHDGLFCGNPFGLHTGRELEGNSEQVFKSLLSHYTNTIFFHGHTHTLFEAQEVSDLANYDNTLGGHSVHIPSLAIPYDVRSGSRVLVSGKSQGYLVDVYANHIVLQGREFTEDKFLPIATFCLDTTLKTIEAGTYTDPTGTITV